jgi:hypothetical protein
MRHHPFRQAMEVPTLTHFGLAGLRHQLPRNPFVENYVMRYVVFLIFKRTAAGRLAVMKCFACPTVLVKTRSVIEMKNLLLHLEFLLEDIYGHDEQWPVILAG